MPAFPRSFTEAAADAVARAIAGMQKEAIRERELRDAQCSARLAEIDVRLASIVELERRLSERLAMLKDGAPGRDGIDGKDGVDGRDGVDGQPGAAGVDGKDGADGKDGLTGSAGRDGIDGKDGVSGRDGVDGSPGKDGLDGKDGQAGAPGLDGQPGRDGIDGKDGVAGTDGKDGIDGADGRDGADGKDGASGRDGVDGASGKDGVDGHDGERGADGRDGKDGAPGERGSEGSPGKLPIAREWMDGVHYEGAVVTHAGSAYQAMRDTGREPPHDDWICLARGGRDGADGRSFKVRGTWSESESYQALDVVALGGASFAARKDDPGTCPGAGWQLIAAQGKRGAPGERGTGVKGERGLPGSSPAAIAVDDEGLLTLTNGDGSRLACDLYPLLTKLAR